MPSLVVICRTVLFVSRSAARGYQPVAMVADAFCDVTKQNDLVLDIFLGSGTSLIAAERVGRRFRGLDIDPAYVDLAIQRWSDITGREPVLVHQAVDQSETAS
jgi:DNA modification methylase